MMRAMRKLALVVLGITGLAGTAAAQAHDATPYTSDDIIGAPNGPGGMLTGYIYTGEPTVPHGSLGSRIIFLNNCKGETTSTGAPGCRITRGTNNSRTNTSSIASGNLAAYTGSDATWDQIVQCVRETYAPFNVTVTDVDPGPNTPHFEGMAAGLPGNIGFGSSTGGVSPFSCGIINNAISFSFLNASPNNVNQACWIIAQETAHAVGLSHSMNSSDPMTYIPNPPSKRFQNTSSCIGTQGCCQPTQECQCQEPNNMQNSYAKLLEIFGPSTPTPPVITIETPLANAAVSPGFVVRAMVSDESGVESVQLLIDNAQIAEIITPPYAFNAPTSITPGIHTVTIRATDRGGTEGTASVMVNVGEPCENSGECAAQGSGLVCVDGRCVPGESQPGGLGTLCTSAVECNSGVCATKDGENRCVENCDLAANACPDNYECLSNGAGGGLCWPSPGGCLGCSTDGRPEPTLPIFAGLFVGYMMVRRRRAKAR
jgi:hypothetical protein